MMRLVLVWHLSKADSFMSARRHDVSRKRRWRQSLRAGRSVRAWPQQSRVLARDAWSTQVSRTTLNFAKVVLVRQTMFTGAHEEDQEGSGMFHGAARGNASRPWRPSAGRTGQQTALDYLELRGEAVNLVSFTCVLTSDTCMRTPGMTAPHRHLTLSQNALNAPPVAFLAPHLSGYPRCIVCHCYTQPYYSSPRAVCIICLVP